MSIRDIPKNPLIEKLDGIFASFPTINVKGKKWRRRRNAFFLGELLEIEAAIQAGADENVLRAQYAELIQYRGSEQNQMDFKLRMDIFQDIPKTKTKRKKGKKMTKNEIEQRILVAISDMKEYMGRGLLEDWQKMCDDLNISPIPTSVMQCKKVCPTQISRLVVFPREEYILTQ